MINRRSHLRWIAPLVCLGVTLISTASADDGTFVNQVGILVEYYEFDHAALPPLLRELRHR